MRLRRWSIAAKTDLAFQVYLKIFPILTTSNNSLPQHPTFPISRFHILRLIVYQRKKVYGVAVKHLELFILCFLMFRPQQSSARHLLQQHWYPVPQCCLRPLSQTLGLWDGWDLNLTWQTRTFCAVQMCHLVFLSLQASASHTSPTGRSHTVSNSTQTRTNRTSLWQGCPIRRLFRYISWILIICT